MQNILALDVRRQVEGYAHAPLAIKAGLSPEIVADLRARKRPANMKEDEAAVYDFVTELSTKHEVSDETFARARKVLGEQQVVDLTTVSGTYVTVAMGRVSRSSRTHSRLGMEIRLKSESRLINRPRCSKISDRHLSFRGCN